jgi:STE24 endopeptidase
MSEQVIDPQRQKQAREYTRRSRQLLIIELVLGVIFLVVILLSGLSSELRNLLEIHQSARVTVYFLILLLSYTVISAPLSIFRSYILPHRYGLSHQSWKSWLVDEGKEMVLGLVLSIILIVVVYLLLDVLPQYWWVLAFVFTASISIVMTKLAPVLILPLFFKLKPVDNSELRQRLLSLAESCQTEVKDVFQINFSDKFSTGNAMLMGWGNTRRIAISDTLLQYYTPEEIEIIMAHELGHHRHRDIAKLIAVQSILLLLGFYLINLTLNWAVLKLDFNSIADVAAFPVLALVLGAFFLILTPLANAFSRRLESAADRYALDATSNPEAFSTMLTKLTNQNLAESEPSKWAEYIFYSHPPYYKRLELARRYHQEEQQ